MIESSSLPSHRVVAGLTIGGVVACNVIGALGRLEIVLVAGDAVVRHGSEAAVRMAGRASNCSVSARQRELRVEERGAAPCDGLMASITAVCPAVSDMVRTPCLAERLLVTGLALDRRTNEVSDRTARVAPKAGYCRVSADQGETRLIVHSDLAFGQPVVLVVALAAPRPQL